MTDRLLTYPFVIVRVACRYCPRSGAYRLARLAAKYGPDISLDDLLERLAFDCPWRPPPDRKPPGKYAAKCGAYFPDLGSPRPPDVPPGAPALRVIAGGRRRRSRDDEP